MKYKKELLIFLFFTLLAVGFTYPLVFKMNTGVYGYPGDNFGTMWGLWWNKYSLSNNLPMRYTPFLNAPFGRDLGVELNSAVLYIWPLTALSFLFNEVVAFNLVTFASFPLAAFTMYLLVKHLTKNRWAAILSGLIFSFSPYHFWKAYNHADLASIQWLPLYVYCLVRLFEERSIRWAFLTAASFALVTLTSFYYGYFMVLFTVGFVIVTFLFQSLAPPDSPSATRRRAGLKYERARLLKLLKVLLLTGVLAAVFILPFIHKLFFVSFSSSIEPAAGRAAGSLGTTTDELLSLSSRPWDFLVPSGHHPIFGKYTDEFYGWLVRVGNDFKTQSAFSWERNIYLGWVGILLSLFALKNFRKNDDRPTGCPSFLQKSVENKKWVLTFAFLALLMVWISFPAFININGRRIYFPSYFLHRFAPMFRTYVRLGVVVLLCVAVLAGFGFKFLLEKIKSRRLCFYVFLFSCFLVLADFTNIPPFRVTTFEQTPAVYQWLKEQPGDFIVAEYPRPYNESEAMFFQRIHQKRLATVTEELADIYQTETVGKLKDLGVKYVVVHTETIFPNDPYNGNRAYQVMSPPGAVEGLKSVMPLPKAIVYEIDAD